MSKSKIKKWSTLGKRYDKENDGSKELMITFEENLPLNASIPVDAPLAVSLMRKLIENIPPNLLYPPAKGEKLSDEIRKLKPPTDTKLTGNEKADASKSFEAQLNAIANQVAALEFAADLLIRNSLAITADKGTLMKALSQPDCEGLRFYLCVSEVDSDGKPTKLSLVIIAVDIRDNDLGYEFKPEIRRNIDQIDTRSFTAEYNKTSGPLDFYNLGDQNHDLAPYVLLRYALNATDHPNPPPVP